MNQSLLHAFYEEQVLPTLFERLDRAFPEFRWTRNACSWTAQRVHENGSAYVSQSIVCHHNWGFVDQTGTASSWLAYVSGTSGLADRDFATAVRHLATLAGIHESAFPHGFSSHDINEAYTEERRRHLMECFIGYCQAALHRETSQTARQSLHENYQMDERSVLSLPIGYFTTADDLAQRLAAAGFSRDEIVAAHVVCDPRLAGRLIVPWRDRWGRVATIVAFDAREVHSGRGEMLYLRGGSRTESFGLDVVLRPGSGGRDHLVLVDGILDVLYLQSLGVSNVASTAKPNGTVTSEQWQHLSDHGIRTVTLALADHDRSSQRTVTSLKQSYAVERAPRLFTLTGRELAGTSGAASFVRREGLERFRRILKNRVHGYHFLALDIVERHRSPIGGDDQSLGKTLYEAAEFDRAQRQSRSAGDLERHFWTAIVDQTGVRPGQYPQPGITGSSGGVPPLASRTSYRDLGGLLFNLELALRTENVPHFRSLLAAAARKLGDVDVAGTRYEDWGAAWTPQRGPDWRRLLTDLQQAYRAGDFPRFKSLIDAATRDDHTVDRRHESDDNFGTYSPWRRTRDDTPSVSDTWDTDSVANLQLRRRTTDATVNPHVTQIRDLAYALWDQRTRPKNSVDSC